MTGFIQCPTCKTEIPLTEVIDHEIHQQLEARLATELAERERTHADALAERELRAVFDAERKQRDEASRQRAEDQVATELADLRAQAEEREALLKQSNERQLQLRQERRKLEDERQALDLELARRLDAERRQIAAKAREDYPSPITSSCARRRSRSSRWRGRSRTYRSRRSSSVLDCAARRSSGRSRMSCASGSPTTTSSPSRPELAAQMSCRPCTSAAGAAARSSGRLSEPGTSATAGSQSSSRTRLRPVPTLPSLFVRRCRRTSA